MELCFGEIGELKNGGELRSKIERITALIKAEGANADLSLLPMKLSGGTLMFDLSVSFKGELHE